MDLHAELLSPGGELPPGSAAQRALAEQLARLLAEVRAAFASGAVARQFPAAELRASINARDPFPGSMCLGLTLGGAEEPTSLAFVARHADDFLVSLKSDGVRYLLLRSAAGGLFLHSRAGQTFELVADAQPRLESVLDGELVFHSRTGERCFLLFDALLFRGQPRFDREYGERLRDCQSFEAEQRFEGGRRAALPMFTKDFFRAADARVLVERLARHPLLAAHVDGLILARRHFPYLPGRSAGNLKWKPVELNSIDFLLVENARYAAERPALFPRGLSVVELYVGRGSALALFDFAFLDAEERERLCATEGEGAAIGCIAEMRWDAEYASEAMDGFLRAFWGFDSELIQQLLRGSAHSSALQSDAKAINALFSNVDRRLRGKRERAQGSWRLIRPRPDKQVPNAFSTAENVLLSLDEQQISSDDLLAALEGRRVG